MEPKLRELLKELQNGFKLESRPFKRIANELNWTEEEVLEQLKLSLESGLIRRIGVAVRPEKIGHFSNALVAWEVPADRIDSVGEGMAELREISHCYERECPEGWNYNLFTMIHAKSPDQLEEIITGLKKKYDLENYKIYKTVKELKKTSMRYFEREAD
jgi:DNA-binding Lrp family transcriptional regulator